MGCCEVNSFLFAKNSDGHLGNLVILDNPIVDYHWIQKITWKKQATELHFELWWLCKVLNNCLASEHFLMCAEQGGTLIGKQQAIA